MKQVTPILHFLRILPLSIFAEWTLFLPVVVIAVSFITGMHWFLESNGRYFDLEYLGFGVNFAGFIALWIVSTMATHLGNPMGDRLLSIIPLKPWKKTTLIIIEHLMMTLIWVALPFGIIAAIVHPVGFQWIWFFVLLVLSNSAFFFSTAILRVVCPFLPNDLEELCLSDLALGFGIIFFFVFVAPWMGGLISGITFPIISILILVLSIIITFVPNFIRIQQKVNEAVKFKDYSEVGEFTALNRQMIEGANNIGIPYKVFFQLTTKVFINFIFMAAGLFFVHSIGDYWMYDFDEKIHVWLGVGSRIVLMIDDLILKVFVPVGILSMSYFYYKIYVGYISIWNIMLDCRLRPIKTISVVTWSLINVIILALGIRTAYSGFALELLIGLNATLSLIVFFSGGVVFAFAMLSYNALGKTPELSLDDFGYLDIVILFVSGLFMLYVLMTNAFSNEDQPIGLHIFAVMIIYNIGAMHWMWKRS